ncbi:MAG: hypothetical protein KFH98_12925 [Gemmatimonadetes bacterium]|nr:hypothetical protein [Gemmatimonadota bacterium]
MTLLRACGLLLLAAVLLAAVLSHRETRRKERMRDVAAAQSELRATRLAPPGSAPQAGISARANIDVAELPDRLAARLHDNPDFHRLIHRCGVCHATPDPALHTAEEWPAVIAQMSRMIDDAGLLPLSPADSAAVLRTLAEHASR